MNDIARAVMAALQRAEQSEAGAVLLEEDGFELAAARVVSAWLHTPQPWAEPAGPCPVPMPVADGLPVEALAAAYAWLMSGLEIDHVAIADAAGVSVSMARARVSMLAGNRLIYPGCAIAKVARAALQGAIRVRVEEATSAGGGGGKKVAALDRRVKALEAELDGGGGKRRGAGKDGG